MESSENKLLQQETYQDLGLLQLSEAELLDELASLQKGFTTKRDQDLKDYAAQKKKASSYLQFYTPTNIPKLQFLLKKISEEKLSLWKTAPFIDFGAGPGTYTASWLDYFGQEDSQVAVVERGEAMREQAQKFLQTLYPNCSLSLSSTAPQSFLEDEKSVLFFGHVLNEMNWSEVKKLVESFQGQAILWVEPGTSQAFEMVSRLRRYLLESGFQVLYPCQTSSLDCPAVQREGEWCHQVLRTTWPEWIERLAQKLKIDRRTMPLIAHAYQRTQNNPSKTQAPVGPISVDDQRAARVVRLRKETKHSFEWDVCLPVEAKLEWVRVSVVKKPLSKKQQKAISQMNTGEEVLLTFLKLLDQNIWRVQLTPRLDP